MSYIIFLETKIACYVDALPFITHLSTSRKGVVAPLFNRFNVTLFIGVVNAEHERSISKFYENDTNLLNWDMFSLPLTPLLSSVSQKSTLHNTPLPRKHGLCIIKQPQREIFLSKCFVIWRYSGLFPKSHVTEIERNGIKFPWILFDVSNLELVVSIVKFN
jgi:hypothetical protein